MKRVFVGLIALGVVCGVAFLWWRSLPDPLEGVHAEFLIGPSYLLYDDAIRDKIGENLEPYVTKSAHLVKFPFVLTAALRDSNVAKLATISNQEHPEDWLEEHLVVTTQVNGSNAFLRIALDEAESREDAAAILNAVCSAFRQEVIDQDQREQVQKLVEIREHMHTLESKLAKVRAEFGRMRKESEAAKREQQDADPRTVVYREMLNRELAKRRLALLLQSAVESEEPEASGEEFDPTTDSKPQVEKIRQMTALIDVLAKELEQTFENPRSYSAQWIDQSLLEEEIRVLEARVEHVADIEHRYSVELRYLENHPPIKLIRRASP